jgi:predicted enzyme related to lactoylglutathione lyase
MKYVHTNIVAKDWRKLARFYIDVCDCEPVFPERDMSGNWIERLTNIDKAHIQGIHLKLPGYEAGPTLEIFSYDHVRDSQSESSIDQLGFAHIAFRVENVGEAVNKLISFGGELYGEIVEKEIEDVGHLTVVYCKDPEGNIIELQHWQ